MENEFKGLNRQLSTEEMIQVLTDANTSSDNTLHRHVFREALRALVRLAKAEKMLEIKRDVALAVGMDPKRLLSPPKPEA